MRVGWCFINNGNLCPHMMFEFGEIQTSFHLGTHCKPLLWRATVHLSQKKTQCGRVGRLFLLLFENSGIKYFSLEHVVMEAGLLRIKRQIIMWCHTHLIFQPNFIYPNINLDIFGEWGEAEIY